MYFLSTGWPVTTKEGYKLEGTESVFRKQSAFRSVNYLSKSFNGCYGPVVV